VSGCVWEVRPFHYKLKKEGFAPWLRCHGSHSSGSGWVESVASRVSPSVPCTWCPSHKQASVPAQSRKRRWLDDEDVAGRTTFAEHMATIGWILMYLLHYRCKKISQSERLSAHQLLCSVMSYALAGRTLALSWYGACLELRDRDLHDESGIRALDAPFNTIATCWCHCGQTSATLDARSVPARQPALPPHHVGFLGVAVCWPPPTVSPRK